MLRSSLVLSAVFSVFVVQANAAPVSPAVQDLVAFQVTGQGAAFEIQQEILSRNPRTREFKLKTTRTIFGQAPQETFEDVLEADLVSSTLITRILKDCQSMGGNSEKLKVTAGEFEACKLTYSEADYLKITWFAAVPFGVLKTHEERVVTQSGSEAKQVETFELVRYRFGSP